MHGLQWQPACSCEISSRSVKRCRRYSDFLYPVWRPSIILNFRKMQIFTLCTVYDDNLQISSRSVERLRRYCNFFIFNMAVARHFEFVKYANFNITHGLQSKSAYLYKISSRSVERLRRYRDFLISNMAAVRHFEFLKYANFHFLHALQWQSACSCKI